MSERSWQVSASTEVDVPAQEVFDFLARPANHARLDGSGTVRGPLKPQQRLTGKGQSFAMKMKWVVPYVVSSKVVEFEEGSRIAWAHFAKHRWRWEVTDLGDGRSRITETFDASRAPARFTYPRLFGFPEAYQQTVERSVEKVAAELTASRS